MSADLDLQAVKKLVESGKSLPPDYALFLINAIESYVNGVASFINQRPEYITAMKNTRGSDSQGDYCRWSGHAEARRQLAEKFGYTVPHESGEVATIREES